VTDPATWDVELRVPDDAELDAAGESRTIEVREDQSILAAARAADIWLSADCQQGWCCRCAGYLLSGSLDQSDARRYYETDRDAELHLLCTAIPESDCRILVCQYEEMLDERARRDLPPGRSKR
jgi:ferredoxin